MKRGTNSRFRGGSGFFWVALALVLTGGLLTVPLLRPADDSQTWVQSIRDANLESLVFITVKAQRAHGFEDTFTGTGFIVHPAGYVLTCNHVIPKNEGSNYTQIEQTGTVGGRYEHAYPLTIVSRDDQRDVMLLKLPQRQKPWRSLQSMADAPDSGEIVVLGFPLNKDVVEATGLITGRNDDGRWITNAGLSKGMSGGPAFDRSRAVVGIVSGGYEEARLDLLIPISSATILLQSVNSPLLAKHLAPTIGSRVVMPVVVVGVVLAFIYLNLRRHALRGGYGFLTDYGCDPKQARGRVATLAQTYGIKDFQFYDWFATYSRPTNGLSWPDPFKGKRQIRLETIRAYIDEIHRHGGRAWASVQAVGAEEADLADPSAGIYQLLDRDNKHCRYPPDASKPIFSAYFLNKAWADRMIDTWAREVKALGFDGIHWNTLGKIAGDSDLEAKGTHDFLRRASERLADPNLRLSQTLNFVNLAWWNPDLVESGVVAFPYAEVSSRAKQEEYYDAMDNPKLMRRARIGGVMAFYPRWDKPKGWTDSEVMLVRWAEAPKHRLRYLILGDDEKYLTGPYFPEDAEPMSPFVKAKMAGVLHFLTLETYKFLTGFLHYVMAKSADKA